MTNDDLKSLGFFLVAAAIFSVAVSLKAYNDRRDELLDARPPAPPKKKSEDNDEEPKEEPKEEIDDESVREDAIDALVSLGIKKKKATELVEKATNGQGGISVEEIVRRALASK